MKSMLAGFAFATVAALGLASVAAGFAPTANAAPMAPVTSSALFHGGGYHGHGGHGGYRGGSGWGVGIGFSTGGGYYAPRYVQPTGYWTTQYRWVPTTVFAGYDRYGQPVYTTQYVQQAYQVWVETASYYAPSYYRPQVSVGFGYRWR